MIQKFVDRFMAKEGELKNFFSEKHVESYKDISRTSLIWKK